MPYVRVGVDNQYVYFAKIHGELQGKIIKALDFGGFYASVPLGHTPLSLKKVITKQLSQGCITNDEFYSPERVNFLQNLFGQNGLFSSYFPPHEYVVSGRCTGSEGVTLALQLAFEYNWDYEARKSKNLQKTKIIAMRGAYHGSTLCLRTLFDRGTYKAGFPLPQFTALYVDFDDAEELAELLEREKGNVLALILEPIQGDRGIIVPKEGYLTKVRELCNKYEVLMIADEVLTFGRTGEWFGCFDQGKFVRPDVLVIGKCISMGVIPASLVISRKEVTMHPYRGISTFDLTPLTCELLNAGLKEMNERNLVSQAKRKGEIILKGVEIGRLIRTIRGRGLMIGLELTDEANDVVQKVREELLERGLNIDLMSGRKSDGINKTLRLTPPLIVTEDDCRKVVEIINQYQREVFTANF